MKCVVADVKGEEKDSARHQYPVKLADGLRKVVALEMDYRVERYDAYQSAVGQIKGTHVSDAKHQTWIELCGPTDHFGREVDAEDLNALLMKVARDMPRTATNIPDDATFADRLREPIEEVAIEGLLRQLIVDVLDVCSGHGVVACSEGVCGATH